MTPLDAWPRRRSLAGLGLVVAFGHGAVLGELGGLAPTHPSGKRFEPVVVTAVPSRVAPSVATPQTVTPRAWPIAPDAAPAPHAEPPALLQAPARAHTPERADAPTPPASSTPLPPQRAAIDADYLPSALLEQSPLPVSAPDERVLTDSVSTGLPLTIRLLIDAQGQVRAVLPQDVHPDDQRFFERLQAMFLATSFLPGRQDGRNVPTRLDLVIQSTPSEVQDLSGLNEILATPPAPPAGASHP